MIVVDMPKLFEHPRHLVLAFMAGLSRASGMSAQCYLDQLVEQVVSDAVAREMGDERSQVP